MMRISACRLVRPIFASRPNPVQLTRRKQNQTKECFAAFRSCFPGGIQEEALTVVPVCWAFQEALT